MEKIIIAGFPGVGKSSAETRLPGIVADMESSDFHWIFRTVSMVANSKDAGKAQHPAWPQNYIDAICMMANETSYIDKYKDLTYVCCSTHKEVLEGLLQKKVPFVIVAPKTKEIFLNRYRERGSSPEFIKSLDENWDTYMEDINSYGMPIIYTDEYLSTILDRISAYAYMLDKVHDIQKYVFDLEDGNDEN